MTVACVLPALSWVLLSHEKRVPRKYMQIHPLALTSDCIAGIYLFFSMPAAAYRELHAARLSDTVSFAKAGAGLEVEISSMEDQQQRQGVSDESCPDVEDAPDCEAVFTGPTRSGVSIRHRV